MIEILRNHSKLMRGTAGIALVGTLATGGAYKTHADSRETRAALTASDLSLIRPLRADIIHQEQLEAARSAHRIAAAIPTPASITASPYASEKSNTVSPPASASHSPSAVPAPTSIHVDAAAIGQFWFGNAESTAKVKTSGKLDNAKLAYEMAKKEPWFSIGQVACLDNVWAHESGFDQTAQNPTSRAGGIPQANPESKMASAGADWSINPATQMAWGLTYIDNRYGTPCAAWDYWQVHSNY